MLKIQMEQLMYTRMNYLWKANAKTCNNANQYADFLNTFHRVLQFENLLVLKFPVSNNKILLLKNNWQGW